MAQVPIKILGVSATPIKDGNCDKLTQAALKAAAAEKDVTTEFVTLANKKIAYCLHCQYCMKNRSTCKIKDDAQPILEAITAADGIIFATPTWIHTVAVPFLNLMSRTRYVRFFTGEWRNKVAGFLTLGWFGTGYEKTLWTMEDVVAGTNMIPVAWGNAISSTVAKGERADFMENGVLDDSKGVQRAEHVALRVVEVAKIVKWGLNAGIELPPPYLSTGAKPKGLKKLD